MIPVGLNGLALLVPMPPPDVDWDSKTGLGALTAQPTGGPSTLPPVTVTATDIADMQAELSRAQANVSYWQSQASYLSTLPGRDENYRAQQGAIAKLNEAQNAVAELTAKIVKAQAQQSVEQAKTSAATTAAASSPQATAQAERDYVSQYARQVQLLRSGGFYDFGAGTNARRAAYRDAGLGDTYMDIDGLDGLDLDFFEAAKAAINDPSARAEFSKITSPFSGTSLPKVSTGVKVPAGVSNFFSGLFKAGKAAASNISQQKKDAAVANSEQGQIVPSAGGPGRSAMSSMTPYLIVAAVLAGGYILTRRHR